MDQLKPPPVVYDDNLITIYQALDQELCQAIITLFNQDQTKWRGKVALGSKDQTAYQQETKSSWDLEILNEGIWAELFQQLHPKIEACIAHYISRSPVLQSCELQVTGYKIQMYPQNEGFFRWHADSVGLSNGNRVVAMVLYLNDVAQGGETEFLYQKIKIAPKSGHLVLFPTGWNYLHCGHTPESGSKYIIQTFVTVKS